MTQTEVRIFAAAALLSCSIQAAAAGEILTYAGCVGQAAEYALSFHAPIVLNQRLLDPALPVKTQLEAAIRQQIRYIEGHWHNGQGSAPAQSQVLREESLKLTEIKFKLANYGATLTIDNIEHPEFTLDEPYLARAVKLGKTQATDPGIRAEYSATVRVVACAPGGAQVQPTVQLALPLDPYLFYWAVAPENRRPIHWRQSSFRVNPCADPEIADLPNPMAFWYFWNPAQTGNDADGKPFACATLLPAENNYVTLAGHLSHATPATSHGGVFAFERLPKSRAVRATALWGIIDPKAATLPIKELTDVLQKLTPEKFTTGISALLTRLGFGAEKRGRLDTDRGSVYFADFLRGLPAVLKIERLAAHQEKDSLILELQGKLLTSARELSLKIFFGPTDVLSKPDPQHWTTLATALAKDDLIFYNGHSGLGENTSVKNILAAAPQISPDTLTGPAYQLVAFLSCYSYSYFGGDLVALRTHSRQPGTTDVVYTGSEFTSERGVLGLLDFLDRSLSAKHLRGANVSTEGYLRESDFLIVKRHEHSPLHK